MREQTPSEYVYATMTNATFLAHFIFPGLSSSSGHEAIFKKYFRKLYEYNWNKQIIPLQYEKKKNARNNYNSIVQLDNCRCGAEIIEPENTRRVSRRCRNEEHQCAGVRTLMPDINYNLRRAFALPRARAALISVTKRANIDTRGQWLLEFYVPKPPYDYAVTSMSLFHFFTNRTGRRTGANFKPTPYEC